MDKNTPFSLLFFILLFSHLSYSQQFATLDCFNLTAEFDADGYQVA